MTRDFSRSAKQFLNTRKFAVALILALFAFSLTFAFFNIYVVRTVPDTMIITMFYVGFMVVCLMTMIILNIRMLFFLKKRQQQKFNNSHTQQHCNSKSKHYQEAVYTLLTISGVSLVTTFPLIIVQFYIFAQTFRGKLDEAHVILTGYTRWVTVPFLLNTGFNANIYVARNKDIRLFYGKSWLGFLWCNTRTTEDPSTSCMALTTTSITEESTELNFSNINKTCLSEQDV